jgi:ankyrin repeat protein
VALDYGAYINAAGREGTALSVAALSNHMDIVSLLCERGADVNSRPLGCFVSIEAAVYLGHLQIVKKLIKYGADVSIQTVKIEKPSSLVLLAVVKGHSDVMAALMRAGAELDDAQQSMCIIGACTVLSDAAAARVTRALLPYCSSDSLTQPDTEFGYTALAYALSQGKLQVARALHAASADVHCTTEQGTVMHSAVESESLAVVKWLQSVGVDPRAVNDDGELPLHLASQYRDADVVRYLLDLPNAADDLQAQCHSGLAPLHYAAGEADSIVELLLQRGAHVSARDVDGETPLMHATTAAAVKLLLAAGADAAAVDSSGGSVLHHHAAEGVCSGAICLLLKAGADPTAIDSNGSTAAHIAGISGHFALEALLSRAAEDYRKKHPTAVIFTDTARSSSSSSGASSSVRAKTTAVGASKSSNSSSCSRDAGAAITDNALIDTTAGPDTPDAVSVLATATAGLHLQQLQQQQHQCGQRKAKQPCANCSKPTTKLCRRCAAVYYCSVECQVVCFKNGQHRAQCAAKAAEMTSVACI